MKTCTRCHQTKSLSEFQYHPKTADRHAHICKKCKGEATRAWNRQRTQTRPGYVYLIRADNGLCKIGIADNIESRFRLLELGSPVPLVLLLAVHVEDATNLEAELHTYYQSQHSHGEWFKLSGKQIEEAQEILCNAKSQAIDSQTLRSDK